MKTIMSTFIFVILSTYTIKNDSFNIEFPFIKTSAESNISEITNNIRYCVIHIEPDTIFKQLNDSIAKYKKISPIVHENPARRQVRIKGLLNKYQQKFISWIFNPVRDALVRRY